MTDEERPPARPAGRYLPIDEAAERAVLSALLTSPAVFDDISDRLTPEDFGLTGLGEIYRAILACDAAGKPFDQITVADELRRAKTLTKAGGTEGLERLAAAAVEVDNVASYVDIVLEKSLRRRLVDAARGIATEAQNPTVDAADALENAESSVFELGQRRAPSTLVTMAQAVAETMRGMTERRGAVLLGHSTGFTKLDELTGGMQPGQLWILAARPGIGKSAMALQIARAVAAASGSTALVPFLSYEMSTSELTLRLLAQVSGIGVKELQRGDLPAGSDRDFAANAQKIAGLPLLIDDSPPETIGGIRSAARRIARRGELALLVVDYIQLMRGDGRRRDETKAEEVGDISRGLKLLGSELGIPVLALSQLNRQVENRPGRRPQLSDLRDSGSLEQDASLVMFLSRDIGDAEDTAELILAKQRSGPAGVSIPMRFDGRCTRFSEAAGTGGGYSGGGYSGGGEPRRGGYNPDVF